jgi:hypothetical protein
LSGWASAFATFLFLSKEDRCQSHKNKMVEMKHTQLAWFLQWTAAVPETWTGVAVAAQFQCGGQLCSFEIVLA